MSFERIFESSADRAVMIGLFLALLELIREKLVWAEQPASASSIYLRPLTEKSAEQAVQEAVLAIAETSDAKTSAIKQRENPPIAIAELPPKGKPAVSSDKQEKRKIKPAKDHPQH